MTLKNKDTSHVTDLLFTLSLFCLFAVSAFFVIMIGIRVYQNTVDNMADTYSSRTSISYVTEKIRQHDISGNISVENFDGTPALVLTDTVNGEKYLTYIYADETALYELSVKNNTPPQKNVGNKILDVDDFTISDKGNGLYEFKASVSSGTALSFYLHLRSTSAANVS